MQSWVEISYRPPLKKLEEAQNYFWQKGAQAIVENADEVGIKGYFYLDIDHVDDILQDLDKKNVIWQKVIEQDWNENFRKSCTTFKVDPEIYIVPSFEINEFKKNKKDELFIEMDPENAFGTGHHQTTKLCLTAIAGLLRQRLAMTNVLDIGTGSGILAILLGKLGVKNILATDTDDDALRTAKNNALKNDVKINFVNVKENYIYEESKFDLIIANILSGVLIQMADNIINASKKNAYIILSGILKTQEQDVINAYLEKNTLLVEKSSMDEWCLLIFRKI